MTTHIPISKVIDCPDNISSALNQQKVLLIMLQRPCVCLMSWTITLHTVMGSPGRPEPDWHIWSAMGMSQLSLTLLTLSCPCPRTRATPYNLHQSFYYCSCRLVSEVFLCYFIICQPFHARSKLSAETESQETQRIKFIFIFQWS